jgi:hypothetical protein
MVANGHQLEVAINETPHGRAVGLAQALRCSRNRIEHRLQLGGRARDDAKHLGGRSLILERFLQLALARLLSLKQPRVLDGDDGLVGEGLNKGDLSRRERFYLSRATVITPIGRSPRSSGTARAERPLPARFRSPVENSASARVSGT